MLPCNFETRGISKFIVASFQAAISETSLHKKWLHADVLHEYIHQRYCTNGLQFSKTLMIRCISKACQSSSYIANYIELSNGTKLDIYIQHQRSNVRTGKLYYFYISTNGTTAPTLPTSRNIAAWEADIAAVNRVIPPATRQRPAELVDVVLCSSNNHSNSNKRPPPSLRDRSPDELHTAKRTKTRRHHGGLLIGGSSIAPSSCDDDATSSPDDDAVLASSSEEGRQDSGREGSGDVITEEHTLVVVGASEVHRSETYWDSPEAKDCSDR